MLHPVSSLLCFSSCASRVSLSLSLFFLNPQAASRPFEIRKQWRVITFRWSVTAFLALTFANSTRLRQKNSPSLSHSLFCFSRSARTCPLIARAAFLFLFSPGCYLSLQTVAWRASVLTLNAVDDKDTCIPANVLNALRKRLPCKRMPRWWWESMSERKLCCSDHFILRFIYLRIHLTGLTVGVKTSVHVLRKYNEQRGSQRRRMRKQ